MNCRLLSLAALAAWGVLPLITDISDAMAYDPGTATCRATPTYGSGHFHPGSDHVHTSNNLRRMTGEPEMAEGAPLIVEGQLLDEECVPIEDAIVELWHANHHGRHGKNEHNKAGSIDPNFAGSGRTSTDNNGMFRFVTIYPGSHLGAAPHMHVRFEHEGYTNLTTTLFLADDTMKDSEKAYRNLSTNDKLALTGKVVPLTEDTSNNARHAHYTIVLKGTDAGRMY